MTENAAYSHVPGGGVFFRADDAMHQFCKGLVPDLMPHPPAPSNLDMVNSVEKVIVYCYICGLRVGEKKGLLLLIQNTYIQRLSVQPAAWDVQPLQSVCDKVADVAGCPVQALK